MVVADTEEMSDRGRSGFSVKEGKGCSSWTIPLQRRYPAIGNQNMGTMYHWVLVKTWAQVNEYLGSVNLKAGIPPSSQDRTTWQTQQHDEVGEFAGGSTILRSWRRGTGATGAS